MQLADLIVNCLAVVLIVNSAEKMAHWDDAQQIGVILPFPWLALLELLIGTALVVISAINTKY
jgi:hypothetical protein